MHRFFYPKIDPRQLYLTLSDSREIHHLKNVLRLKPHDTVMLFNGEGKEAIGIIQSIKSHAVDIRIQDVKISDIRKKIFLTLACAIPKNAKFEWIIEKATELGVDEIIPLQTQRSEVRLNTERADKKNTRYKTIALNAAKQCQRTILPVIKNICPFSTALKTIDEKTLALIPHLSGERGTLREVLQQIKNYKRILFFIGPEGDFTPEEINQATKAGCIPISLGETVLKVDTAAISVIAFARLFCFYGPLYN